MHPTGKLYPDEPSGDVAVQSDSALPSPPVSKPASGSESDLTTDLTPGRPDAPATKKDTPTSFGRYAVRMRLGSRRLRLGLPRPRHAARSVCGDQSPPRRRRRAARRGRAIPPGGPQARRLSHPGIVTVYDVGLERGQIYIVSDFLDGPDLGQWLRENRPAWPEAARIAAAVADALAHAHARLIVHRDVKPANIIVTPDRGPVLMDLGWASTRRGRRPELGVISGTPRTRRPSKSSARSTGSTVAPTSTARSGAVRDALRRLPFQAKKTSELLRQVRHDDPQPPRELCRESRRSWKSPPEGDGEAAQDRNTTAADLPTTCVVSSNDR